MKSLTLLKQLLETSREYLGTNEMPTQALLIYAYVADRGEVPMAELVKLTGLAQSSVSRNCAKLGAGETPRDPGYGLIEAYEDPYYRKRKLVKVTHRGRDMAQVLEKSIARTLQQ